MHKKPDEKTWSEYSTREEYKLGLFDSMKIKYPNDESRKLNLYYKIDSIISIMLSKFLTESRYKYVNSHI